MRKTTEDSFLLFRILETVVHLFPVAKDSAVWFMLSPILLNYTKERSTLTALLKQEAKVINRGAERKELFPTSHMLSPPNGSHNAAESKRESEWVRQREQDVASTVCFWLIMHFFHNLFIEDRFIIPICQTSKDFN